MSIIIKINDDVSSEGVLEIDETVYALNDKKLQFLRGIMFDYNEADKKPNLCLGGIKKDTAGAEIFYYKLTNDSNILPSYYNFTVDTAQNWRGQELNGYKELVLRTQHGIGNWKRTDAKATLGAFWDELDMRDAQEILSSGTEQTHRLPFLMEQVRSKFENYMNQIKNAKQNGPDFGPVK